jgi:hypothetical protein
MKDRILSNEKFNDSSQRSRGFSIALAVVAWFAVLLQCWLSLLAATQNGKSVGSGLVNFLGYFTILTNLLVCISLTLPLSAPTSALGKFFSRSDITAGVATSILFVGISYHILLRNVWHPQGLSWIANALLHYVIPLLYLIYWWFISSKAALPWRDAFYWGAYPTVYLVYVLLRGRIIGTYPYTFIDASAIGYQQTMINGFSLLFCFIVLGLILVALGRLRGRQRR